LEPNWQLFGKISIFDEDFGSSIGDALGALFGIPFKIALLAGFIHLFIYVVLKISKKNQPGEIKGIKAKINNIKEISNKLKSI